MELSLNLGGSPKFMGSVPYLLYFGEVDPEDLVFLLSFEVPYVES